MRELYLKRNYFPHGTFGFFWDENHDAICKSVERKWDNNKKGASCVPEGDYLISPHHSPKHGDCYILESMDSDVVAKSENGVALRTHILIHKANLPEQLEGCIAPGLDFGVLRGKWAVLNSRSAFDSLMSHLNGESAILHIQKA